MKKELELLYEANYTRYLSMFEMQELKKQMDSISSYFRKNCLYPKNPTYKATAVITVAIPCTRNLKYRFVTGIIRI